MARMVAIAILKKGSEPHHIYQEGILGPQLLLFVQVAATVGWRRETCLETRFNLHRFNMPKNVCMIGFDSYVYSKMLCPSTSHHHQGYRATGLQRLAAISLGNLHGESAVTAPPRQTNSILLGPSKQQTHNRNG